MFFLMSFLNSYEVIGPGKTTLAVHLAVLADAVLADAVLVDLDPQRSAGDWWRAREADVPALVETDAGQLADVIAAAEADNLPLAIVDTPPHAEQAIVTAAQLADLVIIPTRPGILDLRAVGRTVDIVRDVGTAAAIVLNACPPGRGSGEASIVREARASLKGYGLPVARATITQRVALGHALIDGLAIYRIRTAVEGPAGGLQRAGPPMPGGRRF